MCRKGLLVAGPWGVNGTQGGWVGVEMLWAAGLEPWVGYFTSSVTQGSPSQPANLLRAFDSPPAPGDWAGRSPAPPGMWDISSVGPCPTPKTLGKIMDSLNHRKS